MITIINMDQSLPEEQEEKIPETENPILRMARESLADAIAELAEEVKTSVSQRQSR